MINVVFKTLQGSTAKCEIDGQDISKWLRGVRIDSTVDDMPGLELDLVGVNPMEFEVGEVDRLTLNILVPPGTELVVAPGDGGGTVYSSRDTATEL